jgi:hypothetical protein
MKYITKILILGFAFVFVGFFLQLKETKSVDRCSSNADCPPFNEMAGKCKGGYCVYGETPEATPTDEGTGTGAGGTPPSTPTDGGGTDTGGTPPSTPTDGGAGGDSDYGLGEIKDLPKGEISDVIVRIIRYVLGITGVILFAMLVYGGFMYMTSAGNEEQIKKAKNVLTYAIIGIVIIAFAFLITEFVIGALGGG